MDLKGVIRKPEMTTAAIALVMEWVGVLSDSFQSHHNQDWEEGQCQDQPNLLQHWVRIYQVD